MVTPVKDFEIWVPLPIDDVRKAFKGDLIILATNTKLFQHVPGLIYGWIESHLTTNVIVALSSARGESSGGSTWKESTSIVVLQPKNVEPKPEQSAMAFGR
jgi:hypothetical protein